MKRKTKAILFLALSMAILIAGCTIVVTPKTSEEWDLYYRWDNEQYYSHAVWALYSNGTFEDNYGYSGYWNISGTLFQLNYDNSAIIIYDDDIYAYRGTVYTSTFDYYHMQGTMSGLDKNATMHRGTWHAFPLTSKGTSSKSALGKIESMPHRTPSGEPIENQENEETNL
jgi:hypothetical protein